MSEQNEALETPKDIRITDPVIKRMIVEEQRRLGDSSPTKTAGRIVERYFAVERMREPQVAAAASAA